MRFGAGPPPPRPRASSVGTAVGVLSSRCDRHAGRLMLTGPVPFAQFRRPRFRCSRSIAPAGYQDHDDGGEKAEDRHPPDVPDQRKAHDDRKEGGNETGWAVARHFDRFIGRFHRAPPRALHLPERVDRLDPGQHREIVGRRRRRGRPLQGSTVPRVAGQVAALLARADADIELRDLAEDAAENDDGPGLRDQQQRLPARVGDVLQAPGHAHQAQHIERHEGEIEADEPAPEAGLAEAFVEGEPERLREPVIDSPPARRTRRRR